MEQKLAGRGAPLSPMTRSAEGYNLYRRALEQDGIHYDTQLRVTRVGCGDSEILNSYNETGQLIQRTDALGNITKLTMTGLDDRAC